MDAAAKAVFNERAQHTSDICRDYKQEISERYKEIWPDKNYETVMTKATLFINRAAGFLWCRVPKAGSESLTSLFIHKWYGGQI